MATREFDIVLLGATGFTGLYTAEHITTSLPTDLSWAIAGRSQQKLEDVVESLKKLNPDRKEPAIIVAHLNDAELDAVAKRTKLLLSTVGPYAKYGEGPVKACANNGTHYLDVTGESPWVLDMINKYNHKAKSTGAIIIPQAGVESSIADMTTYALTSVLRKTAKVSTKEVVLSLHEIKGSPSGGTLATIFNIFESYSVAAIVAAGKPSSMCPAPLAKSQTSLLTNLAGIRVVPSLGVLTTSPQASADLPLVHRSFGLLLGTDDSYGANFQFNTYLAVRNTFIGVLVHFVTVFASVFLMLKPARWALSKYVYQPGQGSDREDSKNDYLEYRALAIADTTEPKKKVYGKFAYRGSAYHLTGILLAEGAATILYDEGIMAKKLGGGLLTPATLGQGYIDRIVKSGVLLEASLLDY